MEADQHKELFPFLQRAAYLIRQHQQGLLTAAEQEELHTWIGASLENQRLFDQMTDPAFLQEHLHRFEKFDTEAGWNNFRALHFPSRQARLRPLFGWWSAAAILLMLVGIGLFFRHQSSTSRPLAAIQASPVVPGHSRALLTLADGSVIPLDSNGNRVIAQQGATVQQQNGQLQYLAQGDATTAMNMLTTPRGGQFRLTLPDGTKVWLNAASSIRYPTAFTGTQRTVEIRGEAYFEVAPVANKPFTVKINQNTSIAVLGTGFNVNAYTDEPFIRTTLIEGAISVHTGNTSRVLAPGQQALVNGPAIQVSDHADTTAILAWKREAFYFQEADISSVMRQLSRWYDVTVVYEGSMPSRRFQGEIERNLPLADVLEGLESTGIHFRLQGRTIIVTP
ncbi:FecR family protein [Chitinophaga costaii]|uniref:FecR family protein n=1 Tax=Chitinophaga costaii TaxID=1335309 RepID=A0A1C3ZMA6_9BACT|nr:FecR family protein [Chitinophaga costaii]PUZ30429.1 FecR family protein [Chitinophaga costaii]SCB83386.1 FecR family protein [Chitinophaga costaii]